eukprot:1532446-Pyramimonas_sp.AAC.2
MPLRLVEPLATRAQRITLPLGVRRRVERLLLSVAVYLPHTTSFSVDATEKLAMVLLMVATFVATVSPPRLQAVDSTIFASDVLSHGSAREDLSFYVREPSVHGVGRGGQSAEQGKAIVSLDNSSALIVFAESRAGGDLNSVLGWGISTWLCWTRTTVTHLLAV